MKKQAKKKSTTIRIDIKDYKKLEAYKVHDSIPISAVIKDILSGKIKIGEHNR